MKPAGHTRTEGRRGWSHNHANVLRTTEPDPQTCKWVPCEDGQFCVMCILPRLKLTNEAQSSAVSISERRVCLPRKYPDTEPSEGTSLDRQNQKDWYHCIQHSMIPTHPSFSYTQHPCPGMQPAPHDSSVHCTVSEIGGVFQAL